MGEEITDLGRIRIQKIDVSIDGRYLLFWNGEGDQSTRYLVDRTEVLDCGGDPKVVYKILGSRRGIYEAVPVDVTEAGVVRKTIINFLNNFGANMGDPTLDESLASLTSAGQFTTGMSIVDESWIFGSPIKDHLHENPLSEKTRPLYDIIKDKK